MRARLCAVFLFRDGVWQRKAVEARYNELAELARQDIDTVWTESGEPDPSLIRERLQKYRSASLHLHCVALLTLLAGMALFLRDGILG